MKKLLKEKKIKQRKNQQNVQKEKRNRRKSVALMKKNTKKLRKNKRIQEKQNELRLLLQCTASIQNVSNHGFPQVPLICSLW